LWKVADKYFNEFFIFTGRGNGKHLYGFDENSFPLRRNKFAGRAHLPLKVYVQLMMLLRLRRYEADLKALYRSLLLVYQAKLGKLLFLEIFTKGI
jgi:hypothetical protein